MSPDKLHPAPVPPRERFGWREWAALVIAVGFALGIWIVYDAAASAKHASESNRQIGYRNRAAVCDFIKEFGGVEPASCADPVIRRYRDLSIHPGEGERKNTTVLLCSILAALRTPAAQCVGDG